MPATFTPVTDAEMRATLTTAHGWTEDTKTPGYEIVLVRQLVSLPGAVIKVYTSLSRDGGVCRSVGSDAIRVCAVDLRGAGKGLVKSARVHRTQGWRENLLKRVHEVFEAARRNYRP